MNDDKILIEALRRLSVQTGSIACLGCEYEYDCGIYGCPKTSRRYWFLQTADRESI